MSPTPEKKKSYEHRTIMRTKRGDFWIIIEMTFPSDDAKPVVTARAARVMNPGQRARRKKKTAKKTAKKP